MRKKKRKQTPASDLSMTIEEFKAFTNKPHLSNEEATKIMLSLDTLTKLILRVNMN
jgi:hypothetical protein